MLKAEIEGGQQFGLQAIFRGFAGIRLLLNHVIHWDFCVLLSEQDAPPDSAKLGVVWQGRNGASSQPRACMRPCLSRRAEDYPLRANSAFAEYLWMHRGTSFVSVDEDGILVFVCAVTPWVSHATCAVQGECERDVSYQCGDRVVSLLPGAKRQPCSLRALCFAVHVPCSTAPSSGQEACSFQRSRASEAWRPSDPCSLCLDLAKLWAFQHE